MSALRRLLERWASHPSPGLNHCAEELREAIRVDDEPPTPRETPIARRAILEVEELVAILAELDAPRRVRLLDEARALLNDQQRDQA